MKKVYKIYDDASFMTMVEDLDNLMRETIDKEHHGTFYLRDHVEVTVEMKYKPEDK